MNQADAEKAAGGNRWRISVELTWDVKPEDFEPKFPGDTIADFRHRAFQRIRKDLGQIVGPDKPFAHYQALTQVSGCVEFD